MPTYNSVISRDASNDPLELPEVVSTQIIQDLPRSSAVMALARRVTMSSKKYRQPVLSVLPDAYWVNGDTGLKQTTSMDWANVVLTAEPIASLVVIPDEYIDDTATPIWSQVRPRLVQAIGKMIDQAVLWGTNKPTSWTSSSLYDGAVAAGNQTLGGAGTDLAVDLANMGQQLDEDGFPLTGWISGPGFEWRLVKLRSTDGHPIYAPPAGPQPSTLYGRSFASVMNGAWDRTKALVLGGDWDKCIIGVRQDITFSMHTDAIISDDSGNVVFNAMQQDSKILRVVTRVAFAVADPTTTVGGAGAYPFAVLKPGSLPS